MGWSCLLSDAISWFGRLRGSAIPQRLAQQLAARLRLIEADTDGNPIDRRTSGDRRALTARLHASPAAIDGDPVDDVVRAYFSLDYHDHERFTRA
jgi:hypothetical protein